MDEARETGTSAESLNSAAGVQTVWSANGSATNGGLGNWAPDGVGIYNNGCRGYVEYDVIAPRDDIYRIEIEGREKGYNMPRVELPLDVSLDGDSSPGRTCLMAPRPMESRIASLRSSA